MVDKQASVFAKVAVPAPPKAAIEPPPRPVSSKELPREEVMWDTKFLAEDDQGYQEDERGEVRDKKFKQLLMKNKQLLVMLEKERTARMKLEKEVREYQTVLNSKPEEENQSKTNGEEQDWKNKAAKFEKKLQEERIKGVQLKNDLEKAVRIIRKEVGEFESLDKLVSAENAWKGRAQEIELLKAKLKDYTNLNKTMTPNDRLYTKKK